MLVLGQGHRDALPLVLQPRAQASFPPTAGRALTVVASSSHRRQPQVTMQLLFASGQKQPVWAKCRLVVVVLVLVLVLMLVLVLVWWWCGGGVVEVWCGVVWCGGGGGADMTMRASNW